MKYYKKFNIALLTLALFTSLVFISGNALSDMGISKKSEIVIGIFPRRDPVVTMKLFRPLGTYLQDKLGVRVRIETTGNFESFENRLRNGRYDIAHMNQYHYIRAKQELDIDVFAQNEEFNEQQISGAIYVRKDSGIESLEQLRGKTILFGGNESAMMSYIVPVYLLQQAGLNKNDYVSKHAATPPNAVIATYLRQADAAGAGEIVIRLPLVKNKINSDEIKIISESQPMPHLPWIYMNNKSEEFKDLIRNIFLNMKNSEEGRTVLKAAGLTGLNAASDSDYDIHRKIIQQVQK